MLTSSGCLRSSLMMPTGGSISTLGYSMRNAQTFLVGLILFTVVQSSIGDENETPIDKLEKEFAKLEDAHTAEEFLKVDKEVVGTVSPKTVTPGQKQAFQAARLTANALPKPVPIKDHPGVKFPPTNSKKRGNEGKTQHEGKRGIAMEKSEDEHDPARPDTQFDP